jgi:hypothetical protein
LLATIFLSNPILPIFLNHLGIRRSLPRKV